MGVYIKIDRKITASLLGIFFVVLMFIISEVTCYFLSKKNINYSGGEEVLEKLATSRIDKNFKMGIFPSDPPVQNSSWINKKKTTKVDEIICQTPVEEFAIWNPDSSDCYPNQMKDWSYNGFYNRLTPNNYNPSSCYKVGNKKIFNVSYRIDKYGRRISTQPRIDKDLNYMLFLGGSFVSGQGVQDEETLPSQMAKWFPNYRMYNYGIPGSGLSTLYALTLMENLKKEINEPQGIVLYFYFDFDMNRLAQTLRGDGDFLSASQPELRENSDGGIQISSRSNLAFKIRKRFYDFLRKSYTLSYFNIDFPKPSQRHFALFSRALSIMAQKYKSDYGAKEFIVVAYPNSGYYFPELKKKLEADKVRYIDFSDWRLGDIVEGRPYFQCDMHPTAESHKVFAKFLSKAITDSKLIENK